MFHVKHFGYDKAGRQIQIRDPRGALVDTVYDKDGRVKSSTDRARTTTRYEYDDADRQTLMSKPVEGETETFYDDVGRVTQTTGPGPAATS